METELNFDQLYLGFSDGPGGTHLATTSDVRQARKEEPDQMLLLSHEAEKFCYLVVMCGMLPSEAYEQAFLREDEFGTLIKPDMSAYQSRHLLRTMEVKERIKEMRGEVAEWGKTSYEEVEANLRRIALDPHGKAADRITATRALSALRGFDAQPQGLLAGAQIMLNIGWQPKDLSLQAGHVIDQDLTTPVTAE